MKLKVFGRDRLIYALYVVFLLIVSICLWRYFTYLSAVVPFDYDWSPTDGDHLNFAHRLSQGLPIYFSLESGQLLSIYNPLYHEIVALLGGDDASLRLARSVALFFWLLCPLIAYWYARIKWGHAYAILAAIFIFFPPQPGMLFEIVHVNADSLMACLFLGTLVFAERIQMNVRKFWWELGLLGILAALCYLAKQQGIMAIAVVTIFFLIKERKIRGVFWVASGFLLFILPCIAYLEVVNSGQFLRTTLFDLSQIMTSSASLGQKRLINYLIKDFAFSVSAIAALYFALKRQHEVTIWHVSFVLHIPFLLKILGNPGGGEAYFLTFWFTLVMLGLTLANKASNGAQVEKPSKSGQVKTWINSNATKIILFFLCLNVSIGTLSIHKSLNNVSMPTRETEHLMAEYYQSIKMVVAQKQNVLALTNRNVGALVSNHVIIENEGCSTFGYAWENDASFNKNLIIDSIRKKKYDLITTGLSPYPSEIMGEIQRYYKVEFSRVINLNTGAVGPVTVYLPK